MKDKHHIDDLFREAFENFEAEPPTGLWEGIAGNLFDQGIKDAFSGFEETPSLPFESIEANISSSTSMTKAEFDSAVKQKLKHYEKQPSESIWQNVKKAIPLNLLVRHSLTQLSKIAGILLTGLMIVFLMGYFGVIDQIHEYFQKPDAEEQKTLADVAGKDKGSLLEITESDLQGPMVDEQLNKKTENIEETLQLIAENDAMHDIGRQSVSSNNQIATNNESLSPPVKKIRKTDESAANNNLILSEEITSAGQDKIDGPKAASDDNTLIQPLQEPSLQFIEDHVSESTKMVQFADNLPAMIITADGIEHVHIPVKGDEHSNMEGTNRERGNYLSRKMDNLQILEALTFKGWYFNVYAQVNNSWVLNDDIRNAISTGSKTEYVLDIGAAYGAGLGFQLSPRIALEANWLHMRQGQRYQEFTEAGVYRTTELNTTYNYFPVWAKIQAARMKNTGGKALTWNYKIGLHYGKLDAAILKTGNEGVAFTENLIKNELGLDLGIEMRLFIDPRFFVSIGGHGSYGIEASTFSGNPSTNAANLNLGLQFGIHYRLKK